MNLKAANERFGDYRFAHDEQALKRRQQKYIMYFSGVASPAKESPPVLDLGCGRGFFLDLLERAGLPYLGVDAFEEAIDICKRRGHANSLAAEALDYMESDAQPLSGVFCSHLIEHFPPDDVQRLLRAAFNRLAPGGRIVLITPNPVNLHVLSETFYLDMSHVRPYPLKLLHRLLHESGFEVVDEGWDVDTAPRYPWWKWPLHAARALILGRNYRQGEDTFIVGEKS